MKISFRKVFRELRLYTGRTLIAMIGILIGVASIGATLTANAILTRELNRNFMNTNPSSIVIKVRNLDPNAIDLVKGMKENIIIEARKTIPARIDRGNGLYGTIYLYAIEDFNNLRVDTFTIEQGASPKDSSQMAIERDCLKILDNIKNGYNENINVKLPGGIEKSMYLSARVHAPGLPPASMEKFSYGFLTLEGLKSLGYKGWYDEIHLVSYNDRFDRGALRVSAQEMKDALEAKGYIVERVDVPEPGKHPHGDQMRSLLVLLQAFTVISLFVAGIIIINLFNFIMSTQTKQIAIMKATGAGIWDIAVPYFLYVLIISIGAIIASIPIALAAGMNYSNFSADILNFIIYSYNVPPTVFITIVAVGILVPLIASAYPIFRSCLITVTEGLSDQSARKAKTNDKTKYFPNLLNSASTSVIIPVNNIFRKKGRTLLAILALSAGGILFMTSQNMIVSINKTVDNSMMNFKYDSYVKVYGTYESEKIINALRNIEGVENAEIFKGNIASFKKKDGTDSAYYTVTAFPENSKMLNFGFKKGASIGKAGIPVIINTAILDEEKWMTPGKTVTMTIADKSAEVYITDVVSEIPPFPSVYITQADFEKFFGGAYMQNVVIKAKDQTIEGQMNTARVIEKEFKASGIEVAETLNSAIMRMAMVEHLQLILKMLMAVSFMAVFVGALSIASAITINIIERRREIGIQRAVGVSSHDIIKMNSLETVLMGFAGWVAGLLVVYPVSSVIGNFFGQIFLKTNLDNIISVPGILIWLVLSIVVSYASGFIPTNRAAVSPLREMLSYE